MASFDGKIHSGATFFQPFINRDGEAVALISANEEVPQAGGVEVLETRMLAAALIVFSETGDVKASRRISDDEFQKLAMTLGETTP